MAFIDPMIWSYPIATSSGNDPTDSSPPSSATNSPGRILLIVLASITCAICLIACCMRLRKPWREALEQVRREEAAQRIRNAQDLERQAIQALELTTFAAPTPRPASPVARPATPSPSYHSRVDADADPFTNRATFRAMEKGSSNQASSSSSAGASREIPNPYTNLDFSRAIAGRRDSRSSQDSEAPILPRYSRQASSGPEVAYPENAYLYP